jgi:8-oxo-dGTP pyrophosphatase MutT (NUDIX family)
MKQGRDYTGVAVVFICHDDAGNILLNKRSAQCRDEQGAWDVGGGGLDFGDTIEDTLRKEIAEEFCTDVLAYEFLGYRDVHRVHDGHKTHWVALDFKVHIDRKKVSNGEPHKFDNLQWFTLDTLPEPMHSQWPQFYAQHEMKLTNLY